MQEDRLLGGRIVRTCDRELDHLSVVLAVKALERVGDHATNIARYVIYAVSGRDVRHVKTAALRDELARVLPGLTGS